MNPLLKTAQHNILFQDFISFLKEIEKQPLELTATRNGNIKVKEIKRLGEVFQHDIYHRDKEGNIMFATRTEDDFYYIRLLKQISYVMQLVFTRNQKIKLSKNGKGFLHNISPDLQFIEMILWYFNRADWTYINWYQSEIVEQLQRQQLSIWKFLLELDGNWIRTEKFYEFMESLIPDLAMEKAYDKSEYSEYESICSVIHRVILGMLEQFDLIDTKKVIEQYEISRIVRFKLNESGQMILVRALMPF